MGTQRGRSGRRPAETLRDAVAAARQGRRGQSMTELALAMLVFCFLLLGVVDMARAYSVDKRLEQGAHLAALSYADPSYSSTYVASYIATQAGLSSGAVTVTKTYSVDDNGNNHVILTAAYAYPLLLPGLRNLQVGAITNGKLSIAVQATANAPTDPPTITLDTTTTHCSSTSTKCLKIAPSTTGTATPSGLSGLVCTVYLQSGTTLTPKVLSPQNCETSPLYYDVSTLSGQTVVAKITQADGVVSQASSPWTVS